MVKKEHRKPPHAVLMVGNQTLYNPCITGHERSNLTFFFCLLLTFLYSSSISNRRWSGTADCSEIGVVRVLISASVSFASWLGARSLFRVWELLKGEEGKTEKTMMTMVARQGRELQRYSSCGGRLVVGCIPYKFKRDDSCTEGIDKLVQVLVISSQKGHGMMFPKGGWESDETIKQAASREAFEEAGVHGHVESKLGRWMYKSNRYNVFYEGIMFPLNVKEELPNWPEMEVRKRRWVSVAEAREGCQHVWMREALEKLLTRLGQQTSNA